MNLVFQPANGMMFVRIANEKESLRGGFFRKMQDLFLALKKNTHIWFAFQPVFIGLKVRSELIFM